MGEPMNFSPGTLELENPSYDIERIGENNGFLALEVDQKKSRIDSLEPLSISSTLLTPSKDPGLQYQNTVPDATISATFPPSVPIPDGGLQAWLTVLGSTAAITATFGLINSIGTIQVYLSTHELHAFNPRDVGWIPAVNIFLCLFLGVQFGPLFDRYGPQYLLSISSVVFLGGLLGMSFIGCSSNINNICTPGPESVRTYALLMVTWGILCGASAAVIMTIALAVIAHWFDAKRGLATGIVYAGSSTGGVIFPLIMRTTLEKLGWDWTIRILLFIIFILLVLANGFIRARTKELNRGMKRRKMKVIDLSCFGDARFLWATIGIAVFEFVVSATVGILPTWAQARGFDEARSFAALAIYNAGSCVGRILAGAVSDRVGYTNTIISILVLSITIIYSLWLPVTMHRLSLFYVFAAFFGFSTGSIMSSAPVCIGQFCKPADYGRYLGTSYSLVSIFCFVSIPVSAEILDKLGPRVFSIMFGAFLAIALVAFCMARWACTQHRWKWRVVI